MTNKTEELKKIKALKKELIKQQRVLMADLDSTKSERRRARTIRAISRRKAKESKSKLWHLLSSMCTTIKTGTSDDVENLADKITDECANFSAALRKFAESTDIINS